MTSKIFRRKAKGPGSGSRRGIFVLLGVIVLLSTVLASALVVTDSASRTALAYVRKWNSVASSANGTKLVATTQGGPIYISTNSGVTWTVRL